MLGPLPRNRVKPEYNKTILSLPGAHTPDQLVLSVHPLFCSGVQCEVRQRCFSFDRPRTWSVLPEGYHVCDHGQAQSPDLLRTHHALTFSFVFESHHCRLSLFPSPDCCRKHDRQFVANKHGRKPKSLSALCLLSGERWT